MKLTDTFAAQAEAPQTEFVMYRDDDQPGFALKVRNSGQRAWVYEARVFGKFYRRNIGSTKIYTAKAARMIAREIAGELRQGIDRQADLRERTAEERAASAAKLAEALSPRLDNAGRDYVAKAQIKEGTKRFYNDLIERELLEWHGLKLKDINADRIAEIYEIIAADRSAIRATKAVKFVATLCGANNLPNPIPPKFKFAKPKARQARLEPSDGAKVWSALINSPTSRKRAFLAFLLMTGCRAGEAARIKSSEVDLEALIVDLKDTKNGTDHRVYITEALANEIRPYIGKGDELVFGQSAISGNGVRFRKQLEGVPAFSNHDLRKCFAITATEIGVPYPVIKRALNHSSGDVTLTHYAQATPSQLRECWKRIADFYIGERNGTTTESD